MKVLFFLLASLFVLTAFNKKPRFAIGKTTAEMGFRKGERSISIGKPMVMFPKKNDTPLYYSEEFTERLMRYHNITEPLEYFKQHYR